MRRHKNMRKTTTILLIILEFPKVFLFQGQIKERGMVGVASYDDL